MKKLLLLAAGFAMISCTSTQTISKNAPMGQEAKDWKLIFSEEFNGKDVNMTYWDTIPRGGSAWNRYMLASPELTYLEDGNLVLKGRTKEPTPEDTTAYETGGLYSYLKYGFQYGRIDIRCKLDEAQGNWPALWLLPNDSNRKWPDSGEIDIMEHLNFDEFVYQTVHTKYTYVLKKLDPKNFGTAKIDREGYNVYSLEWTEDKLTWLVNGVATFEYPRVRTEEAEKDGQWPFEQPYYIILSQQLGGPGTWVGEIDDSQLPVNMYVDYVRVYQRK